MGDWINSGRILFFLELDKKTSRRCVAGPQYFSISKYIPSSHLRRRLNPFPLLELLQITARIKHVVGYHVYFTASMFFLELTQAGLYAWDSFSQSSEDSTSNIFLKVGIFGNSRNKNYKTAIKYFLIVFGVMRPKFQIMEFLIDTQLSTLLKSFMNLSDVWYIV